MFAANTYLIRPAAEDDAPGLGRLAKLGSSAPLRGRALIGQFRGAPAAAISLADGRIIADPLRCTDHLLACLRIRAGALRAYEATPSLRLRMLAGAPAGNRSGSTTHPEPTSKQEAAARVTAADRRRRQRRVRRGSLAVSS
ncbi:MAG TPA: hypothetical protein VHX62_08935 [Solirubrobacteraceae bacterium]|jgi:hypothetical protein|nr:hypothetical protein [Solirubrobacteraceae bacterium]